MVRLLPNSRAAASRGVPARDADDPSGVTMFATAAAGGGGGEVSPDPNAITYNGEVITYNGEPITYTPEG